MASARCAQRLQVLLWVLASSPLCIQMILVQNKVQCQRQNELFTEQQLCSSGNQCFSM